jgi:hypothetical protein
MLDGGEVDGAGIVSVVVGYTVWLEEESDGEDL